MKTPNTFNYATQWIENVRLVLPDQVIEQGAIQMEDGVIADLREGGAPASALDAKGMTLIPGLVDVHGDMIERELEPRPGTRFDHDLAIIELDKRLASSGVTTAFSALSFSDGLGLRNDQQAASLIRDLAKMRSHLLVDHRIHARYEISNTDAYEVVLGLVNDHLLDLISLMDHTPGQGQFRDMEIYVEYISRYSGRSAEEVREQANQQMEQGTEAMWQVAKQLSKMAADKNISLASHDDDTSDKVEVTQSLGVSISEFPVTLEAAQAAQNSGMSVFMGAPNALRGKSHSGNLSALEALEAGVLHGLASDYSPMTMLQAAWKIASEQRLDWPAAIALISHAPAQATGLTDRGTLEVGKRADLVLVENQERPRVRVTWRQGQAVYNDGALGSYGL